MQKPQSKSQNIKQVFSSVARAAFGVQTQKNHQRDFQQGRASDFIIVGIVLTIVFIGTLYLIVRLVLAQVG